MDKVKLKQWNYPPPKYYLGFNPAQRIFAWQILWWLRDEGIVAPRMPSHCSICNSTKSVNYHNEDYFQILAELHAVCQKCHFAIHRRFHCPDAWLKLVEQYSSSPDDWFAKLKLEPWDKAQYLIDKHGPVITDIVQNLVRDKVIRQDCELLNCIGK